VRLRAVTNITQTLGPVVPCIRRINHPTTRWDKRDCGLTGVPEWAPDQDSSPPSPKGVNPWPNGHTLGPCPRIEKTE